MRRIGDTGPPLVAVLRHEPTLVQRAGTPVDLTGATVLGIVRRWPDRGVIESAAATVITASQGAVELPLSPEISNQPGLHSVEFEVTGAEQRTYPGPMDPWWLTMAAVLDGGVAVELPPATGGSCASYLHTQSVASTTWTVNHNLGVLTPDVTLSDSAGNEFLTDIEFITVNQLTVTTAAPSTGTAFIQA